MYDKAARIVTGMVGKCNKCNKNVAIRYDENEICRCCECGSQAIRIHLPEMESKKIFLKNFSS